MAFGTLYLPKGFTLRFDQRIKSVNWSVNNVVFDDGATIDLSASDPKPPRAHDGASRTGQQGYCTPGDGGDPGGDGVDGTPGIDLTITNVGPLTSSGTLWIKTDGGPGGDGGNGGNGQTGGGPRSTGEGLFHGGSCGGAGGGPGGRGGKGGAGGRPGKVTILFAVPGAVPPTNEVATVCGPTTRPTMMPAGSMIIAGAAGCGGQSGNNGRSGGHG